MINPESKTEGFGCKQMPADAQCRSCKFVDRWSSGKRWPTSSSCEKYPPGKYKPEPIRFDGVPCEYYVKDEDA